jgi:ribonucleoside-diphosphate reductase alpha chain
MVSSATGVASGPVSFMNIVNQVTDVVKQGGVRRGANMGMMRVTHPDVLRFIHAKNDQHSLTNFNISVNVTDKFLRAVDNNEWFQSEFNGEPWTEAIYDPVRDGDYVVYRRPDGSTVTFCDRQAFVNADLSNCAIEEPPRFGMVFAPDIWNRIVASAHKYAEPGIAFIDVRFTPAIRAASSFCTSRIRAISARSISRSSTMRRSGSIGTACAT